MEHSGLKLSVCGNIFPESLNKIYKYCPKIWVTNYIWALEHGGELKFSSSFS